MSEDVNSLLQNSMSFEDVYMCIQIHLGSLGAVSSP